MATRHQAVVSEQQKGGVVPECKQKAAAGANEKNWRALGDIGNLVSVRVVEGKPPPPNRPITRSFGAQLLANARAAEAANKKPVAIPADGAAVATVAKLANKVTVKPKPEEVIEISPDNEEKTKEESESSSSRSRPLKKKVHSLTKVLTARSKVACGVTDITKELVHDIDAPDANDQLAVVDYVEDIYKFYKLAENCLIELAMQNSSRPHDYMDSQVEVSAKMRAILVDWLIEVHHKFELQPETLYLTMYVIDRYLSMEIVLRRELQLVGVSAMLIACKYEEIWAPEVNDFICISDRTYTREQILAMEKGILNKLGWNLTVPTLYVFLVRFLKAALGDKEMEHMVFFFAELALMQYSMIMFCPSMVAASSVYAAQCTLNKSPLWTATLRQHTGFSEPQLLYVGLYSNFSELSFSAPESRLKVVFKKYSSEQFGAVALQHPATKLLEEVNASRKNR